VRWSRGLRVVMSGLIDTLEYTDEALATAEIDGELVAAIPVEGWLRIRRAGLEHAILVSAETGSWDELYARLGQAASCKGTKAAPSHLYDSRQNDDWRSMDIRQF
jgi:hypothetical protein